MIKISHMLRMLQARIKKTISTRKDTRPSLEAAFHLYPGGRDKCAIKMWIFMWQPSDLLGFFCTSYWTALRYVVDSFFDDYEKNGLPMSIDDFKSYWTLDGVAKAYWTAWKHPEEPFDESALKRADDLVSYLWPESSNLRTGGAPIALMENAESFNFWVNRRLNELIDAYDAYDHMNPQHISIMEDVMKPISKEYEDFGKKYLG